VMELVLVLIIIVLLGVVGWFVYKNHNKTTNSTTTSTNATNPTTSSTTKTAIVDQYAGWQTYTSKFGSFSFKYPAKGWNIEGFRGETPVGPGYSTGSMNGNEDIVSLYSSSGSTNNF